MACAYAAVVGPLLDIAFSSRAERIQNAAPGIPNRVFWPVLAVLSVVLTVRNWRRLQHIVLPLHIKVFLIYAAFAGLSVVWAFRPEISVTRFLQQLMVLTCLILPGLLASPRTDLLRCAFFCFAIGAVLNVLASFGSSPHDITTSGGYTGYFIGKNYLGEFAAATVLLCLNEIHHSGARRFVGILVSIIGVVLLFMANSKTAIALTLIVPLLALIVVLARRHAGVSPALFVLSVILCYFVVSSLSGINTNRLSYIIYGDSTFTGRTIIWDFANLEIARRPVGGWGYQSFWLIGADAPSVVEAPGFVKTMPNAHNGYVDTLLELGYVGYALLLAFLFATLHAIGRMVDRAPFRAWVVLSISLYIIIYNGLESFWMRGFEFLWVLFVIIVVEIGRCLIYGLPRERKM
jgi:exopolysaccharide production protein ExoQ